jgi:hypothetical protein
MPSPVIIDLRRFAWLVEQLMIFDLFDLLSLQHSFLCLYLTFIQVWHLKERAQRKRIFIGRFQLEHKVFYRFLGKARVSAQVKREQAWGVIDCFGDFLQHVSREATLRYVQVTEALISAQQLLQTLNDCLLLSV